MLGGTSFTLYYLAARRGLRELLNDSEFQLFILIIVAAITTISTMLIANDVFDSTLHTVKYAAVQVVSIVTTTGYVAADFNSWPFFCKMILFSLMLVGGCSSSAAGGMKIIRVLIVFKLISRGIFIKLHPNAFVSIKLYDKRMSGDVVSKTVSFVFLYIVVIFAGSILISLDNIDMMGTVSAVVSSLGNIGPMLSESGLATGYAIFSYPSKLLLSLLMLMGRLELFTVLMILTPGFWTQSR